MQKILKKHSEVFEDNTLFVVTLTSELEYGFYHTYVYEIKIETHEPDDCHLSQYYRYSSLETAEEKYNLLITGQAWCERWGIVKKDPDGIIRYR